MCAESIYQISMCIWKGTCQTKIRRHMLWSHERSAPQKLVRDKIDMLQPGWIVSEVELYSHPFAKTNYLEM